MSDNIRKNWERFLNPEVLRPNLMLASIYIATYEILKDSIISRVRDFYITGFDGKNDIIDPIYYSDILGKNKSPLYASLQWLREAQAITDDDIALFNQVKQRRNDIAHEISRMLSEGLPADFADRFNDTISLLAKIERWWIINVEMQIDPDFMRMEVKEDNTWSNSEFTNDDRYCSWFGRTIKILFQ
ncbi:MAG TPA: hypothetical protein VJ785_05200 [Anaerolineales bacterium]|nr:hypothetical protein [Anaerolineales bacterium]